MAGILLGTDIGEKILHDSFILFDYRNAKKLMRSSTIQATNAKLNVKGIMDIFTCALISLPMSSSSLTVTVCPFMAASMRGVIPNLVPVLPRESEREMKRPASNCGMPK